MIDVTRNYWTAASGELSDSHDLAVDPPMSGIATISIA
jgi:hypothetical protein